MTPQIGTYIKTAVKFIDSDNQYGLGCLLQVCINQFDSLDDIDAHPLVYAVLKNSLRSVETILDFTNGVCVARALKLGLVFKSRLDILEKLCLFDGNNMVGAVIWASMHGLDELYLKHFLRCNVDVNATLLNIMKTQSISLLTDWVRYGAVIKDNEVIEACKTYNSKFIECVIIHARLSSHKSFSICHQFRPENPAVWQHVQMKLKAKKTRIHWRRLYLYVKKTFRKSERIYSLKNEDESMFNVDCVNTLPVNTSHAMRVRAADVKPDMYDLYQEPINQFKTWQLCKIDEHTIMSIYDLMDIAASTPGEIYNPFTKLPIDTNALGKRVQYFYHTVHPLQQERPVVYQCLEATQKSRLRHDLINHVWPVLHYPPDPEFLLQASSDTMKDIVNELIMTFQVVPIFRCDIDLLSLISNQNDEKNIKEEFITWLTNFVLKTSPIHNAHISSILNEIASNRSTI